MPKFKVVEGKLSDKYNIFNDYYFDKCIATNTRLMGVIALKITWLSKDTNKKHIVQLIHLDFSEYGIDNYEEVRIENLMDIEKFQEVNRLWTHMSGGLGGDEIELPMNIMLYFIEDSININERYTKNHSAELQAYRKKMLRKLSYMKERLKYDSSNNEMYSQTECMKRVCKLTENNYEIINYFLMRLIDNDFNAAAYLSGFTPQNLRKINLNNGELMSLIRNKIKLIETNKNTPSKRYYNCKTLLLGVKDYFYASINISVDVRVKEIKSINLISIDKISSLEAAFQIKQKEYITRMNITCSLEEFNLDASAMVANATFEPVPNGLLYTLYKKNNAHVMSDDYYINRDVFGAYLVTPRGELVIMSNEIMNITVMELDLENNYISSNLDNLSRYKFVTQIFHTFTQTTNAKFEDMIVEPINDK